MKLDAYEIWLCEEQWKGFPLMDLLGCSPDTHAALRSLSIITAGLCGEAGEASEHFKKWIRDQCINKREAALELGDVLAYLTWLTAALGYSLEDIAEMNRDKLVARGRKDS